MEKTCETCDRMVALCGMGVRHERKWMQLKNPCPSYCPDVKRVALALLARARDCGVDDDWHVAVAEFLEEVGE